MNCKTAFSMALLKKKIALILLALHLRHFIYYINEDCFIFLVICIVYLFAMNKFC